MASIQINDENGKKRGDSLSFCSLPPRDFKLPPGHTISMRYYIPTLRYFDPSIIRQGGAVANIVPWKTNEGLKYDILIESNNLPDFLLMQELVTTHIGGSVIYSVPASLVRGLVNDLRAFRVRAWKAKMRENNRIKVSK